MKSSNAASKSESNCISIFSPSDGSLIAQRQLATQEEIQAAVISANQAQTLWQGYSVAQRGLICKKAIAWMMNNQQALATEISQQMGRPIQFAEGELKGLKERADYMIEIAEKSLADEQISPNRFIRHNPLGNVFIIAPWNYPYLTAVNSIIPALMAGNCVILKHASQTLLCAERFAEAFRFAGLPSGIFQYLHLSHCHTLDLIQNHDIDYVSFTGSVAAGKKIEQQLAGHFKPLALELGGKDAAYVRRDADLQSSIENLVDGAFFNSGQSCCGIERIYIAQEIYAEFVSGFIQQTKKLILGHALAPTTSLGPMINKQALLNSQAQVDDALEKGAKCHIKDKDFPTENLDPAGHYLKPQVLTEVTHDMLVMQEESFAPIIGLMPVTNDQQALELINDSAFGLTCSIWTQDREAMLALSQQVKTGTVFMNRCDYLDPALPWSGMKNSGRGCALSHLAYQQLSQTQALHLKV